MASAILKVNKRSNATGGNGKTIIDSSRSITSGVPRPVKMLLTPTSKTEPLAAVLVAIAIYLIFVVLT